MIFKVVKQWNFHQYFWQLFNGKMNSGIFLKVTTNPPKCHYSLLWEINTTVVPISEENVFTIFARKHLNYVVVVIVIAWTNVNIHIIGQQYNSPVDMCEIAVSSY